MPTVKELQEQRARIATNARAKFDEITDKTDEAKAKEIEKEFDAMMADYDRLGETQERMEKLEAAETSAESEPDPRRPSGGGGETRGTGGAEGEPVTYDQAFISYLRSMGNLGVMSQEERSVLAGGHRQLETRAQTSGTNSEGGYTVPEQMAGFIVKSMAAWGPMYDPGVTMEMITSGGYPIPVPTVNDTSTAIVQHSEGVTLTDDGGSDVTFGEKTLNAYAYNTEWLRVSKELADDSAFNIEQFLGELLGERLARRANTELTTGDGTGDPNGVVTASTKAIDAAAVAAITFDELLSTLHAVDPAYRQSPRCRWMFNDTTLSAIRKLKYGDGHYIWQMGLNGQPSTLLDFPYSVNQAMPAMTTGLKPILFGDFGKYVVRKVGMPMIGAIQDKDFWPGFGIAGYIRLDGELLDTAAVQHVLMA